VDSKVRDDWFVFINHLQSLNFTVRDCVFLEVGTGWFPTLPICFYLAGAQKCITLDLQPLIKFDRTQYMIGHLECHIADIASLLGEKETTVRSRWMQLSRATDLSGLLSQARIEYIAPADASATDLPDGSVDVVFSNSVLEHVEPDLLVPIMREARRIVKPGGITMHSVDCQDHYSYFDPRISPVNFLRFSSRDWEFWNNRIQYQNRLRAEDFVSAAVEAGFEILLNRQKPRPELLKNISRLSIANEFRRYSIEQLCTTTVDFVATPPLENRL